MVNECNSYCHVRVLEDKHVRISPMHTQLLDMDPQDQAEEDGGHMDLDSQRKGKCAVIKTSTRQVGTSTYIYSI